MELVYEYLDKDVAKWLKENAPAPSSPWYKWLNSDQTGSGG